MQRSCRIGWRIRKKAQIWRCSVKTDLPFLEIDDDRPRVEVTYDGNRYQLPEGGNLAAGLLAAGVTRLRYSRVSGLSRSAYCMMGVCFDCLVELDGTTKQACLEEVRAGMVVMPSGAEMERNDG